MSTGGRVRKRKPRGGGLDQSPQLATMREVAAKFGVTPACVRKWVAEREFPRPHMVIKATWFYRVDAIDHKLRTGTWPPGTKLMGD